MASVLVSTFSCGIIVGLSSCNPPQSRVVKPVQSRPPPGAPRFCPPPPRNAHSPHTNIYLIRPFRERHIAVWCKDRSRAPMVLYTRYLPVRRFPEGPHEVCVSEWFILAGAGNLLLAREKVVSTTTQKKSFNLYFRTPFSPQIRTYFACLTTMGCSVSKLSFLSPKTDIPAQQQYPGMAEEIRVDALVVGAGVGGIYSTYRLSRMGLDVKCIDMAGDVGGTWYWNRYPGAMSDTESYLYRYSWDKEDLQTYPWTHHYVYQQEILNYLQHVVKKHDLRKHMQFNTEMTTAEWDEGIARWRVSTSAGTQFIARYLVNSLGLLSKVNYPELPGLSSFEGKLVHTANWDESLELEGKKVGIIGSGSTGIQVMTAVAPIVGHLTSFQRHPQYSVPSGQRPVSPEYREIINANYDKIYQGVWSSAVGFGVPESTRKTMETSPEERRRLFQEVWDQGNGFRFMFSAFGDLTTDEEANEEACKFVRSKIDEIVKDPRKAKILKPTEPYARRPLCDTGYYQIFNRDNVDVVDLKATPIDEIVPQGIRTSDGKVHELDVLIFATGFDAIEGSYNRVRIVGRDGVTLKKHWENGPRAYGSIACAGFPNMFLISGPQGPFANFPPVIESETNFAMSCIEYAERNIAASAANGIKTNGNSSSGEGHSEKKPTIMEVSHKAEREWIDLCDRLVEGSLFKKTATWIFGTNIVGRKASTNFYFGGLNKYLAWVEEVIASEFEGFRRG